MERPDTWISGACARRALDVSYSSLLCLALLGKVATRIELGVHPRYSRRDVDKLLESRRIGVETTPSSPDSTPDEEHP